MKHKSMNRLLSMVLASCMVATTLLPAITPAAYAAEPAEPPIIPGDAIMVEMPPTSVPDVEPEVSETPIETPLETSTASPEPTAVPSESPSPDSTVEPTAAPTAVPTVEPSASPDPIATPFPSTTPEPSATPSPSATPEPTKMPFVVLSVLDPEQAFSTAKIGDEITLQSGINRDDVSVLFQWQRLQLPLPRRGIVSPQYDYAPGAPTWYNFPLEDKTESQILSQNPDATWPGIELYTTAVKALQDIGADVTDVSFAWKTPNYALDGYTIRANEENGIITLTAEKDGSVYTATRNSSNQFEFGADATAAQENTWLDIEGANAPSFSFTVKEEDLYAQYRLKVTITDEAYLAQCEELLAEQDAELTEEQKAQPQELYSVVMGVQPEPADEPDGVSSPDAPALFAAGEPYLSSDGQWICGLNGNYEYITEDTYNRVKAWADKSNNEIDKKQFEACWSHLGKNGFNDWFNAPTFDQNGLPNGGKRIYNGFDLVDGDKLEVASEWYGKTVLFRLHGSDHITKIRIPAYTELQSGQDGYNEAASGTKYKKAISFLNPFVIDTDSMYKAFLKTTCSNGWLLETLPNGDVTSNKTDNHISVYTVDVESFNRDPQRYMMDAEGNYRMDSVGWGVCTHEEPDLSGKAYWVLKDYLANGYGFLTGHDTMYAYAGAYYDAFGVDLDESSIDPNDTTTWYYDLNSWQPGTTATSYNRDPNNIHHITGIAGKSETRGGHFYLNQLMGTNKGNISSKNVTPADAPSLILSAGGSHGKYGKNIMYGSRQLEILQNGYSADLAKKNPRYRTPTNYPYAFTEGQVISSSFTHSNSQIAFGPIWANYYGINQGHLDYGYDKDPLYVTIGDKTGTNNYYLTGSGNYLMNQIGHLPQNSATNYESILFSNSIMYVSQRKQCEICAANQNGQQTSHFVRRISKANADEVLTALQNGGNYWYPLDGCYMLTENLTLPENWKPIKGFRGHWNSDVYKVQLNSKGTPLLANDTADGKTGWNLGTNPSKGVPTVFDGGMHRTTGVARVVGDLNDLFGTNTNYAGYTVKILGSDNPKYMSANENYTCTVNTDSKYLISNLPCVYDEASHSGILQARVYKPDGSEVTDYGTVRVNVSKSFWDNDMTIPLYLSVGGSAKPVKDTETYEAADATFVAESQGELVSFKRWEVKTPNKDTWETLEPTAWDAVITNKTGDADGITFVESTLHLQNVDPAWDGYEFRAVFGSHTDEWNTYRYFTGNGKTSNDPFPGSTEKMVAVAGHYGKLTVKLWPAYTEQSPDETVMEGESATFESVGYALDNGTSIRATWEYSTEEFDPLTGEMKLVWKALPGSSFDGHYVVKEAGRESGTFPAEISGRLELIGADLSLFGQNAKFTKVTTTLTVNNVDVKQANTHFRVHYTAQSHHGTKYDWYSNIADEKSGCWSDHSGAPITPEIEEITAKNAYSNILMIQLPDLVVEMQEANKYPATSGQYIDANDKLGQSLVIQDANSTVADGTATYHALIYYQPEKLKPNISWEYRTLRNGAANPWTDAEAKKVSGSNDVTVDFSQADKGTMVLNGKTYNVIEATMTIRNVPLSMYNTETMLKYFFRCKATAEYQTAIENKKFIRTDSREGYLWAGLTLDYRIELHHNGVLHYNRQNSLELEGGAGKGTVSSYPELKMKLEELANIDSTKRVAWYYPELEIVIPEGKHINSVVVSFDKNQPHDASDMIWVNTPVFDANNIEVEGSANSQQFIFRSKTANSIDTATWHELLRNHVAFLTNDSEVDFNDSQLKTGAKISWNADEEQRKGLNFDSPNGHSYEIRTVTNPISWADAKREAEKYSDKYGINGHLVEISDQAENDYVQKLLNDSGAKEAWMGGLYENGWKWSNNVAQTAFGYTNWAAGEPADANGYFAAMSSNGQWKKYKDRTVISQDFTFRNLIEGFMASDWDNPDAGYNDYTYGTYFASPSYVWWIPNGWQHPFDLSGNHPEYGTVTTKKENPCVAAYGKPPVMPNAIPRQSKFHSDTNPTYPGQINNLTWRDNLNVPVNWTSNTVTLMDGHIYYTQAITSAIGHRQGRAQGGLLLDSSTESVEGEWAYRYADKLHWWRGEENQNAEKILHGHGEKAVANVGLYDASVDVSTNAHLENGDGELCNYSIIDLTESFGSNDVLYGTLESLGYTADDDGIMQFVRDHVNVDDSFAVWMDQIHTRDKTLYTTTTVPIHALANTEIFAYVVEYDTAPLSMAVTNHSATDTTYIAKKVSNLPTPPDVPEKPEHKELVINISGNVKVYDKEVIIPSAFYVSGPAGANEKLTQVTYRAPGAPYSSYQEKTVNGANWQQTDIIHAGRYTAHVTLTPEAIADGWTIAPQSQTHCTLTIKSRPVNVYSYGNNKVYDAASSGTINDLQIQPCVESNVDAEKSGILPGDTVRLNMMDGIGGIYLDQKQLPTVHNSIVNNNNQEWVMKRDPKKQQLLVVHNQTSDPHYDYHLGTETYTGHILQKGVYVHSLYLEDPDNPRNVKAYDGTDEALIQDIVLDGIVPGDKVSLAEAEMHGKYADPNAGETLTADGKVQPDRLQKLKENPITAAQKAVLSNNPYGDYFIEKEEYSGAIMRASLIGTVRGWMGVYGDGMEEIPYADNVYTATSTSQSWLQLTGLVGKDTLTLTHVSDFSFDVLPDETTSVGTYPLSYSGLTEVNYPILRNYITHIDGSSLRVLPRTIRVTADDMERITGATMKPFHASFAMQLNDNEWKELGSDANTAYADMPLIGADTIERSLQIVSTDGIQALHMNPDGHSNLHYITDCTKDSPALYLTPEDISDPTKYQDCPVCEEYFGFHDGTAHPALTGYPLHVNQDPAAGNVLQVVPVKNYYNEDVENYELVYQSGSIIVHPMAQIQLEVTVPLQVCMYGNGGDGTVIEPINYGITNYSNCNIHVTDIDVSGSWKIRDMPGIEDTVPTDDSISIYHLDKNELRAGEMYLRLQDIPLQSEHITTARMPKWIVSHGDRSTKTGTYKPVPLTSYIARGGVNDAGEHPVVHVSYTVSMYLKNP